MLLEFILYFKVNYWYMKFKKELCNSKFEGTLSSLIMINMELLNKDLHS